MTKGFTLLELLVTIAIIGILVTISAVSLQGARQNARDATRKSDLAAIQSALALYKSDCKQYPSSLSFGSSLTGNGASGCPSSNVYMTLLPRDPGTTNYVYSRTSNTTYVLCARLETPPNPSVSTSGCPSCGSASCNYAVRP